MTSQDAPPETPAAPNFRTVSDPANRPILKGGLADALARPLAHTQGVIMPVIEAKFTPGDAQATAGQAGRSDPFSPVTQVSTGSTIHNPVGQTEAGPVTTPVPGVVPLPALLPAPQLPVGSLPALPTESVPAQETHAAPQSAASSGGTPSASAPPANFAPAAAPPVVPAPVQQPPQLADTVEVRGVVNLSTGIAAVVVLPQERTSRYVKVGDRLADGKVLVKDITVEDGKQPVVVFEEGGREYTKAVGA